jgi:hypothetical protein
MIFNDEWIKEVNEARKTNKPKLALIYKNGFKGTEEFSKNKMTDWEVKSSAGSIMRI